MLKKLFSKVADLLYNKKFKGVIDKALTREIAKQLSAAITTGYGTNTETKNIKMLKELKKNTYIFSGFKCFEEIKAVSSKILDERGKLRNYSDFKAEVLKLHETHNVRYLKAEYDHAMVSSRMASQWVDIQKNKEALPYLQFDATQDNRTTDICNSLDGVTLPVDDEFWNKYYLPLHWHERSVIRQVRSGKVTDKETISAPEVQPFFARNVGKDKSIYNDNHPYFDVDKKKQEAVIKEVNKLFPETLDYKRVYKSKKGGFVDVHPTHLEGELADNLRVAKILAKEGNKIKLLPYSNEANKANPDASINDAISDFKKMNKPTHSSIQNQIRRANKQGASIVVIEVLKGTSINAQARALNGSLSKFNSNINEAWLMYGKTVVKIERSEIKDFVFAKKLKDY
ncbi:MAG: hypothetical protein LC096_09490 [Bacteroidia bacterium]|nr:hypothetical protein [Bacteroidia bacterium]